MTISAVAGTGGRHPGGEQLDPLAERYIVRLERKGVEPQTMKNNKVTLRIFSKWLDQNRLTGAEMSEEDAEDFFAFLRREGYKASTIEKQPASSASRAPRGLSRTPPGTEQPGDTHRDQVKREQDERDPDNPKADVPKIPDRPRQDESPDDVRDQHEHDGTVGVQHQPILTAALAALQRRVSPNVPPSPPTHSPDETG
jgi:hypothetical protein